MPGRLLKLEEGNVHVVEYGTRADAAGTVILIHGLLGSSQFWGCTVDCCNGLGPFLVERGFHVVSYDLWGHGFSDAPDPGDHAYSPEFFSEQLLRLLDALAVQAAHVVGHSLGAVIATTAALTSPDRIMSLVERGAQRFTTHMVVSARIQFRVKLRATLLISSDCACSLYGHCTDTTT